MWGFKTEEFEPIIIPNKSWTDLIEKCKTHMNNSLLLSNMPTQATSHIMNMTECFEPITQLLFSKQVLSGTFIQLNSLFQKDMMLLGLWDKSFSNKLMRYNGNIKQFDEINENIKNMYMTIWDIKPSELINMDADRGAYICQTQSSNRYISNPSRDVLFSLIYVAYKAGLKTASYYLRSKPASNAIKFTVEKKFNKANMVCNDDVCTSCQ
jgi:ribonucleoside-diphosphate reductase alpha chain